MNEKDRRLAEFCAQHDYDGVLLRRRSNIAWITDGADMHCDTASSLAVATVLWTPREKLVFTDNIEAPRLRDEELGREWTIRESPWWEPAEPPAGRYATDWPDDAIAELRFSLTSREVERVRSLGHDTAEVLERILKNEVRPGMTERHLGGAVAGWLRDRGIFGHVILVAADGRIARYRHPIPTSRPIERVVMVAVCAQRHGLIVSITRLVHFGPIPSEFRRRHEAVCQVDAALHRATVPGARWCDVLAEGINAYRETGFAEEWRRHHQGGPMGYECRDFKATPSETRRVLESQLVGWNPSIAGTKSEDTILTLRAAATSHCEVLTTMSDWPTCGDRPDILVR
jgi:Xaa-Pro aminopeptidase